MSSCVINTIQVLHVTVLKNIGWVVKSCYYIFLHQIADCIWSPFGDWGECSKTCGGGRQDRGRDIHVNETTGGQPCLGNPTQSRSCNAIPCPSKTLYMS